MKRYFVALTLLVTGFSAGSFFAGSWSHGQPQAKPPLPRELTSYRDVVKPLLPAVVFIETYARNRTDRLGLGSGFFIDSSGVIVTNHHVVEGAERATIHLHDGRKLTAKNMRSDRRTDLAVILLDVKDAKFPVLPFGDSDAMEIGDRVLAVGAPFGLAGSVTHGIISGKARSGLHLSMYEDFLQTDAAINPGNSGGPLVNLEGKVIGINAAIKSKSGGFQGVGLATSSNLAKGIVQALRTTGVVKRGYLGAHVRELDTDSAIRLKTAGVVIVEVFDQTPASKAGLKAGDIVTHVSGKAAKNADVLQRIIATAPVNQAVDVDLLRGNQPMRVTVVIEEQPASYGIGDGRKGQSN
ncbi:MAG: trypsin-like peptidase domain-containing protein [Planctomycetes bacterium]|nr:trypsin-like peptidase domain-containing protein [Planctomycetota bacterium]